MKSKQSIGIVSYGTTIPKYRIRIKEIAESWKKDAKAVQKSLGIKEKAVPSRDQDTITMAVNASRLALERIKKQIRIGAIYSGSESHPYSVKSTSAVVGEALGIDHNYMAADLEFACKAGTAGIQILCGLVESEMIEYGLAIGADTAQSRPNDALEYSAAAAGAAYIIGSNPQEIIAKILYSSSFTSDTPDFWRRENQSYPSHAGRFTGKPAYFKHTVSAIQQILAESNYIISDFDHVVLHMPNSAFPKKAAKILGVSNNQLASGFIVPYVGNSYSACSLLGLASVLDKAKPNQKILLCSYGSGSGSDAFILRTTKNIKGYSNKVQSVSKQIDNKQYIKYGQYLQNLNKIQM